MIERFRESLERQMWERVAKQHRWEDLEKGGGIIRAINHKVQKPETPIAKEGPDYLGGCCGSNVVRDQKSASRHAS